LDSARAGQARVLLGVGIRSAFRVLEVQFAVLGGIGVILRKLKRSWLRLVCGLSPTSRGRAAEIGSCSNPLRRPRRYDDQLKRPNSPSLTTSSPIAACRRTMSATEECR